MNNIDKNKDQKQKETEFGEFFQDDFEVIYEGDLPEIPPEGLSDDYKDVLSSLSELDDEETIDYVEENRTGHISVDRIAAHEEEIERRMAEEGFIKEQPAAHKSKKRHGAAHPASPTVKHASIGERIIHKLRRFVP